jgi:hypothetical protein
MNFVSEKFLVPLIGGNNFSTPIFPIIEETMILENGGKQELKNHYPLPSH